MQKEKWLNSLIFDSGLFDLTILSEKEILYIKRYLQDEKSLTEIAHEAEVSSQWVKQIIENGFDRILVTLKEIISKKIWIHEILNEKKILQNELAALRTRFKRELSDENETKEYERLNIPISNLLFSRRAKSVLAKIDIKTLNDLQHLPLQNLNATRNAGPKTIKEILAKAREFGIEITWGK
jgi:predicted DNA-binding protein YlxM (UPF0122 family)